LTQATEDDVIIGGVSDTDDELQKSIDLATFSELLLELYQYEMLPRFSLRNCRLYFELLDTDKDGRVEEAEFRLLLPALRTRFSEVHPNWLARRWPTLWRSTVYQWLLRIATSNYFEYAIDLIIVVNVVLSAIETTTALTPTAATVSVVGTVHRTSSFEYNTEIVFTCIYCFELLFKLLILGWREYWRRWTNRFDFLVILGPTVMQLVILIDPHIFTEKVGWEG
jgi:hypothetical protein